MRRIRSRSSSSSSRKRKSSSSSMRSKNSKTRGGRSESKPATVHVTGQGYCGPTKDSAAQRTLYREIIASALNLSTSVPEM
eukprot:690403-Rhodomonas_salina.1